MKERQQPPGEGQPGAVPPADYPYPYPWVRLRSAAGHVFLFQRMVGEVGPGVHPGDVVAVYDRAGQFFGHAFYHDRSQYALRMLSYAPAPVDDNFFRERLAQAIEWRRRLIGADGNTDAYRLVHAEGDRLSGLIAERYAEWIAIEVFSLGIYRRLALFKRLFTELTGLTRFVVRADERIERIEGFHVSGREAEAEGEDEQSSGRAPGTAIIRENGIRFRVDLRSGHKTGFFCDQRENRMRLAGLCAGADVLDVCCYTGGFGIYAKALGKAESVTGVDLDENAIELAKKNANLNQARINYVHADAFAYLRQMQSNGRSFGVVVLDPPKFVATRDDFDEGSRKYLDLNTLGMSVVKPGGLLLTCSCSGSVSPDDFAGILKAAAARNRRSLQFVHEGGAGPDHPIMSNCPESAYLKAVWVRLW